LEGREAPIEKLAFAPTHDVKRTTRRTTPRPIASRESVRTWSMLSSLGLGVRGEGEYTTTFVFPATENADFGEGAPGFKHRGSGGVVCSM